MECAGPTFGDPDAWLAIVGLAPGMRGANRTGRPFTGDYSGELFYATLLKFGLAQGAYRGEPDDGVKLVDTIVLNAVKCLPPGNRPLPVEVGTCRNYLEASLAALSSVRVVIALGQIAHASAARFSASPAPSSRTAPKRRPRMGAFCWQATTAPARTRTRGG